MWLIRNLGKIIIGTLIALIVIDWCCDSLQRNEKAAAEQKAEYYRNIYNNYYTSLRIENENGFTYWYNSFFEHKNNDNCLSVYIAKYLDYKPYLRLKISSNNSIICESDYIYLYADNKTMEIPIGDVYKIEKQKNGQFVDLQIGQMLTEHLYDMSRANTASVRFFNYVYEITQEQKNAIWQILKGYDYLKYIQKK